MRFIEEWGYTVKVGHEEAHQKWLIENDERLRASAPPRSKYIGTFGVVFTSEKEAGFYKTLIEHDSYGAMDAAAAAGKDPNSDFGKLMREASQFYDVSLAAPWSHTLLKDVLDVTVFDPQGT